MSPDLLTAFAVFAFVTSITPGPNNAMLLASGANFGFARSLPHMLGVGVGFLVLLLCVSFGLGGLLKAYPSLHDALQWTGALYLIYLAWKIATAKGLSGEEAAGRPLTVFQAAAFQWVNPKAWAMALGAVTTYAPRGNDALGVIVIAGLFFAINLPCIAAWTGFGVWLRRFLELPAVLRAFNLVLAALLLASLYPLAADLL